MAGAAAAEAGSAAALSRSARLAKEVTVADVKQHVPLDSYFRTAEHLLGQAKVYRAESNVPLLYQKLVTFTSLILEALPAHAAFNDARFAAERKRYKKLAGIALTEVEELKRAIDAAEEARVAALLPDAALPASLCAALPSAPPPRSWETPSAPPPPHAQPPPAPRGAPMSPAAAAAAAVAAAAASLAGASLSPSLLPATSASSPTFVIPAASEATRARHALMPAASQPLPASRQFEVVPPPPPPPPPPPGPPPTELPAGGLVDLAAPGSRPPPPPPRTSVVVPSADDAKADHARLSQRLALYGLREKAISGDGNCQFRALADQLWRDQGRHAEVRARVMQQLHAAPDAYSVFVTEPYAEYCARMGRLGTWGDHLTLQAAADAFRVKLCLLTSYRDSFVIEVEPREEAGGAAPGGAVLWLSFFAEVHYNSLYQA